jgi:hypothetical protein
MTPLTHISSMDRLSEPAPLGCLGTRVYTPTYFFAPRRRMK